LVNGFDQVAKIERLCQVIKSAEAHGFNGSFYGAVACDHDDGSLRVLFTEGLDEIETIHIPNAQIDDDKIGAICTHRSEAFSTCLEAQHGVSCRPAELAHELEDCGLIVYDYYFSHILIIA
jgi:hypothetical protein